MERYIINPTKKKNVVEIIEITLSNDNNVFNFYIRQNFYIPTKQQNTRVSLIDDNKQMYFDADCKYPDIYEELEFSEIPEIFQLFNNCDLFGYQTNEIQNAFYFLNNNPIEENLKYFTETYKINTSIDELNQVKKYTKYYFVLWYMEKKDEVFKDRVEEFHTELRKYFTFDLKYKISSSLFGSLNSILNGKYNAIPFNFMSDEELEAASLEPLLILLKFNPNSSYNYKIKTDRLKLF